jgi:hypothetical protein
MHGGLSPELTSLEDINKIPRPAIVPQKGIFYYIQDYFVIYYGQIQNLMSTDGEKIKEGFHIHLENILFSFLYKNSNLTLFVGPIKLLKTDINFLLNVD